MTRYPPPGHLVQIDGHRLHLLCGGTGSQTVVLEAGLGESALTWAPVQRQLSATTRVCSYDRAGLGWSEQDVRSPTADRSAEDLHQLLSNSGEPAPYVLVGHSIGAIVVRVFAAAYPAEVAGLLFVDPTNEEAVIAAGDPTLPIIERRAQGLLAEFGVMRLAGRSLVNDAVGGNAPLEVLDAAPLVYGAGSHATAVRELEGSVECATRVRETMRPGVWAELPVVVISAADSTPDDQAHHVAMARLSGLGRHIVAGSGGHYVHHEHPELVVDAVTDML